MAHLIKLESGQYLNLDQLLYTSREESGAWNDGGDYALLIGGAPVPLSPKDLEKIDQIATVNEPPKPKKALKPPKYKWPD